MLLFYQPLAGKSNNSQLMGTKHSQSANFIVLPLPLCPLYLHPKYNSHNVKPLCGHYFTGHIKFFYVTEVAKLSKLVQDSAFISPKFKAVIQISLKAILAIKIRIYDLITLNY